MLIPPQRIFSSFLKLHFNVVHCFSIQNTISVQKVQIFSSLISNGFSNSALKSSNTHLNPYFTSSISKPICLNNLSWSKYFPCKSPLGVYFRNHMASNANAKMNNGIEKLVFNPLKIRLFSTRMPNFVEKLNNGGILNSNVAKKVVDKSISSTFSQYKKAMGMHLFMVGASGVFVCILLWRIMFESANTFVELSQDMAKYGVLALWSAMVTFAVFVIIFNWATTSNTYSTLNLNTVAVMTFLIAFLSDIYFDVALGLEVLLGKLVQFGVLKVGSNERNQKLRVIGNGENKEEIRVFDRVKKLNHEDDND